MTDLASRAIEAWRRSLCAAADRSVRAEDSSAVRVLVDEKRGIVEYVVADELWRFTHGDGDMPHRIERLS
jgi:hypothetical protein